MVDSHASPPVPPFHHSADVYDVVYGHLDYAGSASAVLDAIWHRKPNARSLLDVACGTGRHLEIMAPAFQHVEGLDLDDAMLQVARERLGDVPLHQDDLISFDLGRRYDAVTCLFSSIGYVMTQGRLARAVRAMARHLEPGGVLVIEPWLRDEMLHPPWIRSEHSAGDGIVVARNSRMKRITGGTELVFSYLVTTDDGSRMFEETHIMGTFTIEQFGEAFASAGLSFEFLDPGTPLGRGLAVGTQPA